MIQVFLRLDGLSCVQTASVWLHRCMDAFHLRSIVSIRRQGVSKFRSSNNVNEKVILIIIQVERMNRMVKLIFITVETRKLKPYYLNFAEKIGNILNVYSLNDKNNDSIQFS